MLRRDDIREQRYETVLIENLVPKDHLLRKIDNLSLQKHTGATLITPVYKSGFRSAAAHF